MVRRGWSEERGGRREQDDAETGRYGDAVTGRQRKKKE
jgi:hypothetical protein